MNLPYKLHDFQVEPVAKAVARLKIGPGFALFCEAGAGKTIMAIDILNKITTSGENLLIVCKTTLPEQWQENLDQFLVKGLLVTITTYDQLHKHTAQDWDNVVIDESHKFKSLKTDRRKNLFKLKRKHQKRLILTGTPMDGKLEELWPQIHFLDSSILGDYIKSFKAKYCRTDYWGNITGYRNVGRFQARLNLVAAKTTPLPLPPAKTVYLSVPVSTLGQIKIKEASKTLEWQPLGAEVPMPIHAQPQLDSAHHQILGEWIHTDVAKLIKDIAIKQGKVIVVYWYKRELSILKSFLKDLEVYEFHTGKQQKKEFINSKGPAVLIAQQGVLGEGVDGLQRVCNFMILCSYNYSWTTWHQVKKRIHRIGQDAPVTFLHLYHKGQVTERITNRLKDKQSFVSETLDF